MTICVTLGSVVAAHGGSAAWAASSPAIPTSSCNDPAGDGEVEEVGPSTAHPGADLVSSSVARTGSRLTIELTTVAPIPTGVAMLSDGTPNTYLYYVETRYRARQVSHDYLSDRNRALR